MRGWWLPFVGVLAALSASCGSSSSGAPSTGGDDTGSPGDLDSGNTADTTPTDDADADPGTDVATLGDYPAGPYGTKTGDVLADFELSGYLNLDPSQVTTTAEYRTLRLSDVRAASKVPYLFIHEVGFF